MNLLKHGIWKKGDNYSIILILDYGQNVNFVFCLYLYESESIMCWFEKLFNNCNHFVIIIFDFASYLATINRQGCHYFLPASMAIWTE